ncbi:hypothetical protein I317_02370 [Kwoniella heveanensis CBS 569]|nr:hypothetical protein I317_02370 [Kwoniella heveanensis CBS 569]
MSLPTPNIAHLTEDDYEHIYEPAEDSFILLDALEIDAERIRRSKPAICVEVGAGSGIASAFLSNLLGRDQSLIISTDINPYACKATLRTATANDVSVRGLGSDPILDFYLPWSNPKPQRIFRWAPKLEIIEMEWDLNPCQESTVAHRLPKKNLRSQHMHRLRIKIDLMIFNPPYVPTDLQELNETQSERDIGGAWAGGSDGMEVTNILLRQLPNLLSPGGTLYLVAVAQNKPAQIIHEMKQLGLQAEEVPHETEFAANVSPAGSSSKSPASLTFCESADKNAAQQRDHSPLRFDTWYAGRERR